VSRVREAARSLLSAGDAPFAGQVRIVERTASTQDLALSLVRSNGSAIALARFQTDGRGRMGRRWHETPGLGLAMSIALPASQIDTQQAPARVGIAICRAIESVGGSDIGLLWPNDIMGMTPLKPHQNQESPAIALRKLAGVLIEVRDAHVVIGVGVNVLHQPHDLAPEIRPSSTSLAILGVHTTPLDLALRILDALGHTRTQPWEQALEHWHRLDLLRGTTARFQMGDQTFEGVVDSIEPSSAIVLHLADGSSQRLDARTARRVHD